MRFLIKLAGVLAVLLLLLVVAAAFAIDSLTANAVQRGGTYALGADTTLREVDVGLFSGELELEGMRVANPEGFETDHFLELRHAETQVDPSTLTNDLVVVPRLTLSGIDVNLEHAGGKTNYGVILANLERFESGEEPAEEAGRKKFVIESLTIREITAHLRLLPAGGALTEVDVTVPSIELTDVGTGGGLSMGELVSQVVQVILSSSLSAGGASIPSETLDDLRRQLDTLENDWTRRLEQTVGSLTGGLEGTADAIERHLDPREDGK